jgi:thiol:disulfide interchange protein
MRAAVLILLILSTGTAWAVSVGDTRAAVLAELGKPQSTMVAGEREFLVYGEGRIVLVDGRVVEYRGTIKLPPAPEPNVVSEPPPDAAPVTPRREETVWLTDINLAQTRAAKENKLILALFTGSDWCPPCWEFENEVAHDSQFVGIFSPSFIFFKSDWLRKSEQSEAVKAEVGRLKRKYLITSYPTLLILNAEGERLDEVEWTKVKGGSFREIMIEAIDNSRKATKGGKKASRTWWPFD